MEYNLPKHKHAVLIMAHNNWPNLYRIMKLLDKDWVDFYIHIDKKSIDFDFAYFNSICKHARVRFTRRHNVSWGNESQIIAEMTLFETAYKTQNYWYYHFMSGSDLPIKRADEIYNYFENTQQNFLLVLDAAPFEGRLATYINPFRQKWIPLFIRKKLNVYAEIVQYKLHIDRLNWLKKRYPNLGKGHNWCDLTQSAVEALIQAKKDIKRFTRFTHCSDELYKQIILLSNNQLKSTIAPIDIRYIKWEEGKSHPKDLTLKDYDGIIASQQYLFARKFDEKKSKDLADKIFNRLISENG